MHSAAAVIGAIKACAAAVALLAAEPQGVAPPHVSGPVCLDVVAAADRWGVDPALALATAYRESTLWRDVESPAGARGPMQVMPVHGDGDLIDLGVGVLRRYVDRRARECGSDPPDDVLAEAICDYRCGYGRCDDCSAGRSRIALAQRIRSAW